MSTKYDLCVIGAGPGGYVAAIQAGRAGLKTVLVEKDYLGGTCLNWGCIPTKTLIASAEVFHKCKHAAEFGISVQGGVAPDWQAMSVRKDKIISTLRNGIASLLSNAGVEVISGIAKFADRKTLKVQKEQDGKTIELNADKFIIACGSEPLIPSFIPKGDRVLGSTELLNIREIPNSLLILGGGVIGCEFACLFAELGTQITVVEMMPQLIPNLDEEVSKLLNREMKKIGINVITGGKLENISVDDNGVKGSVGKETLSAEYLLVSIGRKPSTDFLNPQAAGVKINEKGWIPVDSRCRTNVAGIYAIGDVTGRIQLAHMASAMASCAASNAAGKICEFRDDLVPGCIFTSPEIGTVGKSEQQCIQEGIKYKVGKFPFAALGKSMAINETAGFCKIIADEVTDQILGVHIIGAHATDLISEAVTAMNLEATASELGKAIHPHPTLGESLMEAAHAVHGKSAHVPLKK